MGEAKDMPFNDGSVWERNIRSEHKICCKHVVKGAWGYEIRCQHHEAPDSGTMTKILVSNIIKGSAVSELDDALHLPGMGNLCPDANVSDKALVVAKEKTAEDDIFSPDFFNSLNRKTGKKARKMFHGIQAFGGKYSMDSFRKTTTTLRPKVKKKKSDDDIFSDMSLTRTRRIWMEKW